MVFTAISRQTTSKGIQGFKLTQIDVTMYVIGAVMS